jgi:putative nucleotidyltransferase with HDIG domain
VRPAKAQRNNLDPTAHAIGDKYEGPAKNQAFPMNSAASTQDYRNAVSQKIHQERLGVLNPAQRYLDGLASLPPAPMLISKLLALFREPDPDMDQVVELIRHEPSLTAQILRTCNQTAFAADHATVDIFDAVTRMGFYEVYCLVVSLFGAKTRAMPGADKGVNVMELWRHSVAAAVSVTVVTEDGGQTKAEAFTAGLLHDIGKLVLASAEGPIYANAIKQATARGEMLSSLEQSAFVIDHAELGGELMHRWNLPPEIVAAVRSHHEPAGAAPYAELTAAVQLGDMIAHQLFNEDLAGTDLLVPPLTALDTLQLTPDDLPRLLVKSQAALEKVKGMLEM